MRQLLLLKKKTYNTFIHLRQNSVILSTDDKGFESYEWIKSTDDKVAADMQV